MTDRAGRGNSRMRGVVALALLASIVLLPLIGRPSPRDTPIRIIAPHGAGSRWIQQTELPIPNDDLLLFDKQLWQPLRQPADVEIWSECQLILNLINLGNSCHELLIRVTHLLTGKCH